jgi:NTP pyrophosphatase (non-canonical NTP hydrolase)
MTIDVFTIIDLVATANPGRNPSNLHRRVLKLYEELGEVAEAYLNATSTTNGKKKAWADVREEVADVLIVALDIFLTQDNGVEKTRETCLNDFFWIPSLASLGVYKLCFTIGSDCGSFGLNYDLSEAFEHCGSEMVRNAFALASLVFGPSEVGSKQIAEASVVSEVTRKLAKWEKNRRDKVVVTDAE